VTIKNELVPSRTAIYLVQNMRIGGGRKLPAPFAQPQAEFRIFPVQKESLVQQSGVLYGRARY
jgi:hypothetical protein